MEAALRQSVLLDVRFHDLRGEMVTTKERAFRELFRVLESAAVRYALIGGVAVQLWRSEPRTTLDIDVAMLSYEELPREALAQAGFRFLARHAHSENWLGPDDIPVQFTDDPGLAPFVERATVLEIAGGVVRVAQAVDLVRAKLRAGTDPSRRTSKRLQDLADAAGLLEDHPGLANDLDDEERDQLGRVM